MEYDRYEALANAYVAVNESMAEVVNEFRAQKDPLAATPTSLLERTVIPFVTEVAHCGHEPEPMPAVIFGGRLVGMRAGSSTASKRAPARTTIFG